MICGEFLGIKINENKIDVKLIADKEDVIEFIKTNDLILYEKEKKNFDILKLQPYIKWRRKILELINNRENYYLITYKFG